MFLSGIQNIKLVKKRWIPAFAGMTAISINIILNLVVTILYFSNKACPISTLNRSHQITTLL